MSDEILDKVIELVQGGCECNNGFIIHVLLFASFTVAHFSGFYASIQTPFYFSEANLFITMFLVTVVDVFVETAALIAVFHAHDGQVKRLWYSAAGALPGSCAYSVGGPA